MVKRIKLTNSEESTIVDDKDHEMLSKVRWRKETNGYVVSYDTDENGHEIKPRIHRLVLNTDGGDVVDHINGDKLDNRSENLRVVTTSQNGMNRKTNHNSYTGFKGSTKQDGKYVSTITLDRKTTHIGTFNTAEEAAKAYNIIAEKYFGEYAKLNDVRHQGFDIEKDRVRNYKGNKGVVFHSRDKRWQTSAILGGIKYHVGLYDTEEEAVKARNEFIAGKTVPETGITINKEA